MTTASSYHPVTVDRHASLRWQRYSSYSFASNRSLLPVSGGELALLALSFPIAFVPHGEEFVPVAVVGLEPEKNLFVSPDGRWLGNYVPAVLRSYPFAELPTSDGKQILCVDEASGLLTEVSGALGGERLFDESGALSAALSGVLDFLQQMAATRPRLLAATKQLQTYGLIQPWPATVQMGESEVRVEGLYRVDEVALMALSDEAFLELRHVGALPLTYTQMLSTQNLRILGSLATARLQAERTQASAQAALKGPGGDLDLSFLASDTLRLS